MKLEDKERNKNRGFQANAGQREKNQVSAALVCDQHANRKPATTCQDDERLLSNLGRRGRGCTHR